VEIIIWGVLLWIVITFSGYTYSDTQLNNSIILEHDKLNITYFKKNANDPRIGEILKTMKFESANTLDPLQSAANSTAFGLCQWLPDRGKNYKTIGAGLNERRFTMNELKNGGEYRGIEYNNTQMQLIAAQLWYQQYESEITQYGEGGFWLAILLPTLLEFANNKQGPNTKLTDYRNHIGHKRFDLYKKRNPILKKETVGDMVTVMLSKIK